MLIVYVVYTFFIRIIIPAVMRKYINDFQQKFTAENQRVYEEQNQQKEGEISIKHVNNVKNPSSKKDQGEYVDFEEIK